MTQPTNALYRRQALAALRAGEAARAEALLAETLRADPEDALARALLGVAHSELGRHAEARQALRHAARIESDAPAHRYNLGVALERAGDQQEASLEYLAAVRLDPAYRRARRRLEALGLAADGARLSALPAPSGFADGELTPLEAFDLPFYAEPEAPTAADDDPSVPRRPLTPTPLRDERDPPPRLARRSAPRPPDPRARYAVAAIAVAAIAFIALDGAASIQEAVIGVAFLGFAVLLAVVRRRFRAGFGLLTRVESWERLDPALPPPIRPEEQRRPPAATGDFLAEMDARIRGQAPSHPPLIVDPAPANWRLFRWHWLIFTLVGGVYGGLAAGFADPEAIDFRFQGVTLAVTLGMCVASSFVGPLSGALAQRLRRGQQAGPTAPARPELRLAADGLTFLAMLMLLPPLTSALTQTAAAVVSLLAPPAVWLAIRAAWERWAPAAGR